MSLEDQFRVAVERDPILFPDHLVMKYIRLARVLDEHPELLGLHILMLGLINDHRAHLKDLDVLEYNSHLDYIYEILEEFGYEVDWDDDDEDF